MENASNEPVNKGNQSEQNQENQFMTRQDIENIVAQGIANAIPAILAAQKPVEPQQIILSKRTVTAPDPV